VTRADPSPRSNLAVFYAKLELYKAGIKVRDQARTLFPFVIRWF